jgi:hypothetical protein
MRTLQVCAVLALAASAPVGHAAMAQSSPAPGSPGTTGIASPTTKQAPVGHRQPRASDVPDPDLAAKGGIRDKETDRVLNSICRGC